MKKIFALFFAVVFACSFAGAKTSKKKPAQPAAPRPTCVYTTCGCIACEQLVARLKAAGVKFKEKNEQDPKYEEWPTVEYSDGLKDNGQRIYAGCKLPETLKLVKYGESD